MSWSYHLTSRIRWTTVSRTEIAKRFLAERDRINFDVSKYVGIWIHDG